MKSASSIKQEGNNKKAQKIPFRPDKYKFIASRLKEVPVKGQKVRSQYLKKGKMLLKRKKYPSKERVLCLARALFLNILAERN